MHAQAGEADAAAVERADVVVIGAGLGGLLTAAILARRGARVVLLEQEPRVGGRLRTVQTADGFSIDCGAFLWPNKYLDCALEAAGAADFTAFTIPFGEVMRIFVEGAGGTPFVFPWPGLPESPALRAAAAAVYGSVERLERLAAPLQHAARMSDADLDAHSHLSVDDWLVRHAPEPEVADAFRRTLMLFGSLAPGEASIGEFARLIGRRGEGGPAKPQVCGANRSGGVGALVASLEAACRAAGVDVRLGAPVAQLLVTDGGATGVRYCREPQSLAAIEAKSIVCNVPAWTLFDLVPERHFPADFVRSARHYGRVGESVNLAIAFRGLPTLRATGTPDVFRGWSRLLVGPQRAFGGGMMWTTLEAPQNAPAGHHLLHATRHVPRGTVHDAATVDEMMGQTLALLREIYVDFDACARWVRRWVTRDSTEYMISAVPRPPLLAPGVRGLYLVGETVAAGAVQMDNAARAALEVAERIRPAS
jgi:phytoene dehydrogenase-like protein